MKTFARRAWPTLPALVVLWMGIGVITFKFFEKSEAKHLVYSLDDAYIHMTIAKNLAEAGVYGMTKLEFSSSSSSPLWVILLFICRKLFGDHETIPFVLNIVLSTAALVAAGSILRRHVASPTLVSLTTASIESMAHARNVRVAVVYDHWFSLSAYLPPLPPAWLKAGEWTIANNVVCGGPTVSFYATNKESLASLRRNLRDYSRRLPGTVRESGTYLE